MVKKYQCALLESQETAQYFQDLTSAAPPALIPRWTEQVKAAERKRGNDLEVMDIYQAKIPKPAGRREIELDLGQRELDGEVTGQATWISHGLKIEEAQYATVLEIKNVQLTLIAGWRFGALFGASAELPPLRNG